MNCDKTGNENTSQSMEIVYRPIADLELDPRNPRLHSPRQVRQIAHSIKTFGMNVPVLINGAGKVIAGHGRVMACQQLGWTEVPTISLEHLTEAQARAFMIADNRLTENSEWDERLLAEQLKELSELDLDFTLDVTGFEIGEIDLRIEELSSASDGDEAKANSLPDPRTGPPVTRPGDLWLLNDHRVLCGSALEEASYAALMQGQKAQMVFTDPPYNVRIDGNATGSGSTHHREFVMASGEMSEQQFVRFLANACSLLAKHSAAGSLHYVCMDWRHLNELLAAGREAYSVLVNLCVWVKENGGLGSLYRSQHELVLVFKSGAGSHRNNVQLGQYGRNRTNVWKYQSANSFSRSGDEGNLFALHPTVKPAALVADAIMDCTSRRDVVLDGFLGSGTSVIAAERTGRRCFGLEIDPIYVDVIVRRWHAFTRQTARHAQTGRSFLETEAEVRGCGPSTTTAGPKTTMSTE
jgi:DNA modification methylase